MRSVSLKRQRENRIRAKVRAALFMEGTTCEARLEGCSRHATDWHEVRTRARGGSITDATNAVLLCRSCHQVITRESGKEGWAVRHGWVLASWADLEDEQEAWSVRTAWHCGPECDTDHRRIRAS